MFNAVQVITYLTVFMQMFTLYSVHRRLVGVLDSLLKISESTNGINLKFSPPVHLN